ncbi:MAG: hypothetical protein CM15mP74_22180 [Halieaceae bacterium]|nr:MAG: hypothetical protein CM15mP74_22180 [Halieaceae bacterium]
MDVGACVEAGAVLGDRVWIGAGAYVGHGTKIGDDTEVKPGAVICHQVEIGRRCTIHPNATIGADGFGFAPSAQGWIKIEQLASVILGDDVQIGANSAVDRGALEDTVIEDGAIIDNMVQIGHGARVGPDGDRGSGRRVRQYPNWRSVCHCRASGDCGSSDDR